MYESKTKEGSGSHILKLIALKETAKPQDKVLNRITTGIGEIRVKIGLPPANRAKKGASGSEEIN